VFIFMWLACEYGRVLQRELHFATKVNFYSQNAIGGLDIDILHELRIFLNKFKARLAIFAH